MPDPPPPPIGGVAPTVLDIPILGRAVCLGELYDQRSGKFLGVQLYPHDKVQETVTDIRNTDLSVSLSTSHEEKASLLDINAQLSLEVLGGLVKVSGSASYLNDEKSNTHEYAYALALKMRLNEKRILFAEDEMGRKVLDVVKGDYISTNLATHFVSAIVYGGNYIVNLVAKQSELSKEEKVEGKLQAQFDQLKGAISLEGSVEAKIKGEFSNMNDKFDLTVHGDVALDRVPINPQDVLDSFPDAASLISDNGGVPISVTLQPIPPILTKGCLVYQFDADFVDEVLKAFSMLDDLRSHFSVLQDSAKSLQDFIPELVRTARVVAEAYTKEHSKLLHELGKFLEEYQQGKKPKVGSIFRGGPNEDEITGDKVLEAATKLYEKHLDPKQKDDKISKQYPSSLAGLENEFSRFRYFVSDIQKVRKSLQLSGQSLAINVAVDSSVCLSSIDDVCRAMRLQHTIPLFIMTPMTDSKSNPDFTALQYLALVRKYAQYFKDSVNPAYMLYAENMGDLQTRFSSTSDKVVFPTFERPSIVIGAIDDGGNLSWSTKPIPGPPTPIPGSGLTLKLDHKPSKQGIGDLSYSLEPLNGTQAFSIQIRAKSPSSPPAPGATIFVMQCAETKGPFLLCKTPLDIELQRSYGKPASIKSSTPPDKDSKFMATLVQDTGHMQWLLYLNDKAPETVYYSKADELLKDSAKLQMSYLASETHWWDGEVYEIQAFTRALTKEDISAQYAAWKK